MSDPVTPTLDDLRAKREHVASSANGAGPAAPSWPAPLDEAAFHGVAGEIVRVIEPHTEADPAAILVQLLACFGNAIGRLPGFRVEADRHACNLNVAIVGETSKGRKGVSFGQARRVIAMADPDWATRIASGASSGEGLIWQVRDAIVTRRKAKKDEADTDTDGYVDEVTDPGVDDKRLLVYESELASVLGRMGRDGNTLSAVMRQAWDGGALSTLTKNSPARATGAHVAVIAHITAEELRRELTATETANGFANRFLWVCARRSQELPFGGALTDADLCSHANNIADAITWANSGMGGAREGLLDVGDDAREAWTTAYSRLSQGHPGMFGAITSRAEAQARRLAVIYASLDKAREVHAEHLHAALAVWDYCERSAAHLFGSSLGDPLADRVLTMLREAGDTGRTRTEISSAFNGHKASAELARALGVLTERNLATMKVAQTGGRPVEQWHAT